MKFEWFNGMPHISHFMSRDWAIFRLDIILDSKSECGYIFLRYPVDTIYHSFLKQADYYVCD